MISDLIRRVAIVGGTHGNELTGVYLVKKFQQSPNLLKRSFDVITFLANPKAIAANRRYIDRDLNRCFSKKDLFNPQLTSYEDKRAKEIACELSEVDFIIDLHSTTANMGLTVLPANRSLFNLQLSAYLSHINDKVVVCFGATDHSSRLRSFSHLGCAIEVGPVAQGIIDLSMIEQTEMLVYSILDYLDAYNQGKIPYFSPNFTIYQAMASIDYPRNAEGELQAAIHPQRQFQDYQPLKTGDPLFLSLFSKESILYEGETKYPIFINEASYYEEGVALTLTEKQEITL
jgi:succinylglutamate desuccinylase